MGNRDWSESLLPILDRFIAVYDGDIDCVFWNSMIKRGAMSASKGQVEWYSGWINCFFPIINNHDNQWCEPYSFDIGYIQSGLKNDDKYGGIEVNSFPVGLSEADTVIINDSSPEASPENNEFDGGIMNSPTLSDNHSNINNHEEHLKIISGFIGYTQNQLTHCLQPIVGWFIVANNQKNGMSQGFDHRLAGISEDDDDDNDDDMNYDDDDSDGLRLINGNSSNPRIKPSDEDDDDDDDDETDYGGNGHGK